MQDSISIKGARQHNLKNISLNIPRDKITVITGPSGSGKSSLAIDTIYAEGNRRYVESLSPYARQFIEQVQKPDFDSIEGLSPAISIDQKTVTRHLRSTVGTVTEIHNYMRVLYTKIGTPYCYNCGQPISSQDIEHMLKSVLNLPQGTKIQILSPLIRGRKGEFKKELEQMRQEGFVRARIDGVVVSLTDDLRLRRQQRHNVEIVIDRLIIKHSVNRHIQQAIDLALRYSDTVIINIMDEQRDIFYSKTLACLQCGISYPEIEPGLFSFNSPKGACSACRGIGYSVDEQSLDTHKDYNGDVGAVCTVCKGSRLRKEALGVKIGGLSIADFSALSIDKAYDFITTLRLNDNQLTIARRILKEVRERLNFIQKVGLGYLTLDRSSLTLSGGEAQRIRLASQIGSSLTGALYVLDEPSIGLHPRDFDRLLDSLRDIRDNDNTVLIVEHDEDTIRGADYIVDMGPGAGQKGGWVTACGTLDEIINNPVSLTGSYLRGENVIPLPLKRREPKGFIEIYGANANNLKSIDVSIPLGVFCCITGVSGSGKSTLVFEALYKPLKKRLNGEGCSAQIRGLEQIDKALVIEQRPLGRTPRSNPATYTGIFNLIRLLLAGTPEARLRGFEASRFSFNVPGGRCEACQGDGVKKIVMHLLPDAYVTCDVCKGSRYNKETLEITYKGKNIAEILNMTISEANDFFHAIPSLRSKLSLLNDIGLGYLKLGQPANTLSGGEAQRLRLSRELSKRDTGRTLYILDEPTVGLHFSDIAVFLSVIQRLVEQGNTVIVIEHDMNVIKCADYVIDLGPEGGERGGMIMAKGTPEEVAQSPNSYTAQYLERALRQDSTNTGLLCPQASQSLRLLLPPK
jgi:excinuclease ABC subunit A